MGLVGLKPDECAVRAELAKMPSEQYATLWNQLAPCISATRLTYDVPDETAEMLLDRLVHRVWTILSERIYRPIEEIRGMLDAWGKIAEDSKAATSAPSERELDLEKKLYAALEALKTIEAMRPRAMGHTAQSIARRVLSAYGGPPADSNVLERVESREGVAPGLGADAGKDQGGGDNALRSTAGAERAAAGADTPSPLPEAASDAPHARQQLRAESFGAAAPDVAAERLELRAISRGAQALDEARRMNPYLSHVKMPDNGRWTEHRAIAKVVLDAQASAGSAVAEWESHLPDDLDAMLAHMRHALGEAATQTKNRNVIAVLNWVERIREARRSTVSQPYPDGKEN